MVQIFSRTGKKKTGVQVSSTCSDEPQTDTQIGTGVLAGSPSLTEQNAEISVQTFPGTVTVTQVQKEGSGYDISLASERLFPLLTRKHFTVMWRFSSSDTLRQWLHNSCEAKGSPNKKKFKIDSEIWWLHASGKFPDQRNCKTEEVAEASFMSQTPKGFSYYILDMSAAALQEIVLRNSAPLTFSLLEWKWCIAG